MGVAVKRMVVLRDIAGIERVTTIGPCRVVRVPVIMDDGFGAVDFTSNGELTVNGLPIYRADVPVWQVQH